MAFYLLDKEQGITSNKALSFLKRELNIKKAGFSGVLDPFATGLLIVATDGDTKFLDLFLHSPKTYSGRILFGKRTNTLDIDGETISEEEVKIDFELLTKIIEEKFKGKISQVPPKFSNIKVNGKRAHELSRSNNDDFELKPVDREVYSFKISKVSDNEVDFLVTVSSGTYIRSLARDIGDQLGFPSMLTVLRRESVGDIKVPNSTIQIKREDIVPFESMIIDKWKLDNLLNGKMVEIDSDSNDILVNDKSRCLWVKLVEDKMYKIHKNIE